MNKLQNRLSIADERGHTEAVLERLFFGSCKSYLGLRDISRARASAGGYENSNEMDDVERG